MVERPPMHWKVKIQFPYQGTCWFYNLERNQRRELATLPPYFSWLNWQTLLNEVLLRTLKNIQLLNDIRLKLLVPFTIMHLPYMNNNSTCNGIPDRHFHKHGNAAGFSNVQSQDMILEWEEISSDKIAT